MCPNELLDAAEVFTTATSRVVDAKPCSSLARRAVAATPRALNPNAAHHALHSDAAAATGVSSRLHAPSLCLLELCGTPARLALCRRLGPSLLGWCVPHAGRRMDAGWRFLSETRPLLLPLRPRRLSLAAPLLIAGRCHADLKEEPSGDPVVPLQGCAAAPTPLTGRARCHTAACADAWSPAGDWGWEGEEGSNAASVVWTLARARLWPWASL